MPSFPALPLVLLLLAAPASAGHFDVYLVAGQSNAGGHGYVSREFAWFSPQGDEGLVELGQTGYLEEMPDARFIHWRGGTPTALRPVLWDARTDGWIPLKAGYSLFGYRADALGAEIPNHPFGIEVSFGERILRERPGRKIAIIKYTKGATGFGTATAPGAWDMVTGREYRVESHSVPGHCYAGLLQLTREALQDLAAEGHSHELRGLLWHQGEADSGLATPVYMERLKDFIRALREDLGTPDLPVLIGELIQSSYANTRSAQRQVAGEISRAAFVSSAGLRGDSTVIHFDTVSILDFGRRYAEIMLQSTPSLRRASGHWKLDETEMTWSKNEYRGTRDAVSGTDGILYGYGQADQAVVQGVVINRDGPAGGVDRAYDFAADTGISGINTLRPEVVPARGDFTILVWMKTNDPHAAQGHLFSNNNGQNGRSNLHVHNSSLTWFHHGGVTLTEAESPVFDGDWHRVGVMRRGDEWSLLRDGAAVAYGRSDAVIDQGVEWMIGRMRAFNGNFEGTIGEVLVLNHAVTDVPETRGYRLVPGGACELSWTSRPGYQYGLEWSPDLLRWNLFHVETTENNYTTVPFHDPGAGNALFLRVR